MFNAKLKYFGRFFFDVSFFNVGTSQRYSFSSFNFIFISIAWYSVFDYRISPPHLFPLFPLEVHSDRQVTYSSVIWRFFIFIYAWGLFLSLHREHYFFPCCPIEKPTSPSEMRHCEACLVQNNNNWITLRRYSLFCVCWFYPAIDWLGSAGVKVVANYY